MKAAKFVFSLLFCIVFLVGCKPKDYDNKNIVIEQTIKDIGAVDIYYDCSSQMYDILTQHQKDFSDIIYAAASVARDTWYEKPCNVNLMSGSADCLEESFDFFSSKIHDVNTYSPHYYDVLKNALPKLNPDNFSLFVTDLSSQLYDYSNVANLMIEHGLANNLAIGFIGIQLDIDKSSADSIFLIAMADNQNLSKYIDNFKANPTIVSYSEEQTDFQMDIVNKINYQVIANKSGIIGIDYTNVTFVENGFYAGKDGNINKQETQGSFNLLKENYSVEEMEEVIEGTVNFTPNIPEFVATQPIISKSKNIESEKIIKRKIKPVYKGVRSLVYDPMTKAAGKIKVQIPFEIINGVKLSKLNCDLITNVFVSNGSKFKQIDRTDIKVTLAGAATLEQGQWRVDDKTKSVIMNILVPNAGKVSSNSGIIKLDILFRQNDTIDTASNWIKDWDERGCKNLLNFFSSIYTYQKDGNVAENELTIYLAPGDKKITKRLSRIQGGTTNDD